MTQTQPQQQPKGVQYGENTLFLCPDDEYELAFAQAYLANKYPATPAGLYTELPIDSLNSSHTIITLFRPRGCTPGMATVVEEGKEHLIRTDPRKDGLWKEVIEGEPVRIKDHWRASAKTMGRQNGLGNGLALGSVDVRGLFAALSSEECRQDPWCLKPLQSNRLLRIGQ